MIYEKLKKYQKAKGLTNLQVAQALGRSRQWYQDIFKKLNLKIDELGMFAELYEVNITEFFKDPDSENEYVFDTSKRNEYIEKIDSLLSSNTLSIEKLLNVTLELQECRNEIIQLRAENVIIKQENEALARNK